MARAVGHPRCVLCSSHTATHTSGDPMQRYFQIEHLFMETLSQEGSLALLTVSTKQAKKGNERLPMKWLYLALHLISIDFCLLLCERKN